MPLTSKTTSFDQTRIPAGFKTRGLVATRKTIKSPGGEVVVPVSGKRFVCVDNPDAVDAHRMRLDPDASEQLGGTIVRPTSGIPTLAADGASLVCEGVDIAAGKRLVFAWNFMSWGDLPWNDFATFQAVPTNPNGYGVPRAVLCDLAELSMSNRRSTGWRIATWQVAQHFTGTLVWTVANGQEISDWNLLDPAPEAFSNPPAMLIDDIRLFDA